MISFLNELELICLHTSIPIVKWLNGFNYCYQTQIILSNIDQVFLFNTNYSIQDYSFPCTVKWFQVFLCNTNNLI